MTIEQESAESNLTGQISRRTLAVGTAWAIPAVISATPAYAAVTSGVLRVTVEKVEKVAESASSCKNHYSDYCVSVLVENGKTAVTVTGFTLPGWSFTSPGQMVFTSSPTLPQTIAHGKSVRFVFTVTGSNCGSKKELTKPGTVSVTMTYTGGGSGSATYVSNSSVSNRTTGCPIGGSA